MKGILGRKVGMTSVFSEYGKNVPVTIIEAIPNIVTNVFTKEKHGYKALQLSVFDRRDKTVSKPLLGHFKKSKTGAKYFIKEIKDMIGFSHGAKVDLSIFNIGDLVDVTGTSKGKGFAGAIKRHNQSIGPKSHGGGGGSKPVRLTGSLGDVSSNRVFKGQTMPGQMGNVKRTTQNLEIVSIDLDNNVVLVKGSIPGPNKRFVIVKEAIKGLSSREAFKLVDVNKTQIKNELLEEAKKVGANVNTNMSVVEMKEAILAANEAKVAEVNAKVAEEKVLKVEEVAIKAHEEAEKVTISGDKEIAEELEAKAKLLEKQKATEDIKAKVAEEKVLKVEEVAIKAHEEAEKVTISGDKEIAEELEAKAKLLEKQKATEDIKAKAAENKAKGKELEAEIKEKEAESLQVKPDESKKEKLLQEENKEGDK